MLSGDKVNLIYPILLCHNHIVGLQVVVAHLSYVVQVPKAFQELPGRHTVTAAGKWRGRLW